MSLGPVARNDETASFFEGTARGELLLRTCGAGHWSEPEAACCTTCGDTDLMWSASAGTGRVVTWSAVHGRPRDDLPGLRRVIAVVQLDEGPWWWTALEDAVQPYEGQRVQVAFTVPTEGSEHVPYFVPA